MKNKEKFNLSDLTVSKSYDKRGSQCLLVYQGRDLNTRKQIDIIENTYNKKNAECILDWLERESFILNKQEKEYLSGVIRPWRKDVIRILKEESLVDNNAEFITIRTRNSEFRGVGVTHLPVFKRGTMYKGMELDKEYSLEDLGL